MLRILGSRRRLCSGLTRRDFLYAGHLGLAGLGLDAALARRVRGNGPTTAGPFGRAKSCILLLPYGSPPQQETFDPKPDAPAEARGEFGAIPTSVPGTLAGELMPNVAEIMDRLTVVRSMTHAYPLHCTAYVVSGLPTYSVDLEIKFRDKRHWPFVGSVVDYVDAGRRTTAPAVPQNVALPWKMNLHSGGSVFGGPWAAFLGPAYDPVLTDFVGKGNRVVHKGVSAGEKKAITDPYAGIEPDGHFRLAGTELKGDVTLDRLNRRRSLQEQFDGQRLQMEANAETAGFDRYRQMALSLLTSPAVRTALDVRNEAPATRDAYGFTLFGQGCLAARRLVEAGTRFVTVFWDEYGLKPASDWDTHQDQAQRLKGWLMPGFDKGFSALIRDLEQRGLLDETLVIWMSEHGRTPGFNKNAGRDHWSRAYSIALAGAGVARGNVVGATDAIASDVVSTPVSPKDILATICFLLGIDPEGTVPDQLGRPFPLPGHDAQVRTELFA